MTIEEHRQDLKQDLETKRQVTIIAIKERHKDKVKALKSIRAYKKATVYYNLSLSQTTFSIDPY